MSALDELKNIIELEAGGGPWVFNPWGPSLMTIRGPVKLETIGRILELIPDVVREADGLPQRARAAIWQEGYDHGYEEGKAEEDE